MLKTNEEAALLTPLHVAIAKENLDIVKFIMNEMQIDHKREIAVEIVSTEYNEVLESLFPTECSREYLKLDCDLMEYSEEQQAFGILLAVYNEDLMMFRMLWESLGYIHWRLPHFECVMKQILFQRWIEGINFVLKSDVTKQMVISLTSDERSYFIENFIGNPFGKEFKSEIREALVGNLCTSPYAGALLIYMLENFEDLTTHENKQRRVTLPILRNIIGGDRP